jgi:predicted permease
MLTAIAQDARYAFRIFRRNPLFALVAASVVALGTGAVSTIFSVANAVVLRPVPGVSRPSELVSIDRTRVNGGSLSASYPYFEHLEQRSHTMSGIAAWSLVPLTISTGGDATLASADLVTGNYFGVLGAKPAFGRFFSASEDRVGGDAPGIVLSHEFWQRRFNGDSSVLGRRVIVNGSALAVIGVAAAGFNGIYPMIRTDAWVPASMQQTLRRGGDLLHSPGSAWLTLVGRRAAGVSNDAARTELSAITAEYAASVEAGQFRDMAEYQRVKLATLSGLPSDAATPVLAFFLVLLAVSSLVLLIASVNVASMLLARAVARRREIGVRIALGASRRRLINQLVTESALLFTIGGAGGLAVATVATRLLGRIQLPIDVPIAIDASPDVRVLIVTIAVALVTGILFGLAPALQASRADVATTLRGDGAAAGRTRSRLRNALVGGQVAASLLLLTTSGLFVRALARGHRVDPGYSIDHIATASLDVSLSGYDTTRARAFYAALRERMLGVPGVTAVAYTRVLPLSMSTSGYSIDVPGYTSPDGRRTTSSADAVDPGYFDAVHLPIIAGRALLPSDDEQAARVAVVSQAFVNRFWPGQYGLGKTFKLDSSTTVTVVGITRDVKFARLDEPPAPFMYLPIAQQWRPDRTLLVRTTGDASRLAGPIRDAVRALDPSLPIPAAVTFERAAAVSLLPQRFAVIITATLGLAGLLLAAIGLYGVVAFSTAQRTREIGVRIALGAGRRDVVGMIIGDGMRVVGVGLGVGLVLAALASRALMPFLFGVSPLDPATFAGMTLLLAATAVLASYLPARRAASVDPAVALRQD